MKKSERSYLATNAAGFTLIELSIVLVLLSILAVWLGPRVLALGSFDERFYRADLVAAARHAQKIAIAERCGISLTIEAAGFAMHRQQSCINGEAYTQPVSNPANPAAGWQQAAPDSIVIAATEVRFDSLGRALDENNVVSDFAIAIGRRQLLIDGVTGWSRQEAL